LPHCVICKSTNECQLLKGRFFCAECRNDLAACTIDPKRFDAMLEFLRLARRKNEKMQVEEMEHGGLTQQDIALAQTIIRRVNRARS